MTLFFQRGNFIIPKYLTAKSTQRSPDSSLIILSVNPHQNFDLSTRFIVAIVAMVIVPTTNRVFHPVNFPGYLHPATYKVILEIFLRKGYDSLEN